MRVKGWTRFAQSGRLSFRRRACLSEKGRAMINARQLLAREFLPIVHRYEQRDTQLYALGVGLGTDPLDSGQLRYVYEGVDGKSLQALPTFANVLAYPGFWARE